MERVQKLIAASGLCSRRRAEEFIAAGKVTVNGKTIKLGDQAEQSDAIFVGGKRIHAQKKTVILLNKPKGYISAMSDQFSDRTLAKLLPTRDRVYHVGRLDKDARGLIILTNDGDLANKIMHPRYGVTKTYLAQLSASFTKEHKAMVERGLILKDGKVKARVKILDKHYVEITVEEGRHKIVKRIFNELNIRVTDLKRIRIGSLGPPLKEGQWKVLHDEDVKKIFAK